MTTVCSGADVLEKLGDALGVIKPIQALAFEVNSQNQLLITIQFVPTPEQTKALSEVLVRFRVVDVKEDTVS